MFPSGLSIRCSRWARSAILATAAITCAVAEAPADPNSTTSRPAHSASTQPEPTSAKVQLFATQAQGSFREALALTRQEAGLLAKVEDRTDRLLDDPALYMMLAHVARLPRMSTDQLAGELDRPAYGSLLAEPELYRARPIAMRVRVRLIKKLQPPQTARRDGRDPNDNEGALWCMECYNALAKRGGWEPVIVLADFPPTMGKPDRTNPDGEEVYDRSVPEAELAGVFHKLYSVQDPNGQWFDYPVILAWQIDRKGSTTAQPFPLKTFFAVAMVLLGYGILRWQIRRRELMNRREESYRLRAAESEGACSPQPAEVDPLLIQAAQEHQKRKHVDNGTDNPG